MRDGLLADLGADSALATVLSRVPGQFHLPGPGEATTRAFPLAVTRGVHTTGIYYNKAILDRVGLEVPQTFADLRAAVQPLSKIGVAPLVHCSGDVFFNQILLTWVLPMVAERTGDPVQFVGKTVRGDIRYDGPEWTEAFGHIADDSIGRDGRALCTDPDAAPLRGIEFDVVFANVALPAQQVDRIVPLVKIGAQFRR